MSGRFFGRGSWRGRKEKEGKDRVCSHQIAVINQYQHHFLPPPLTPHFPKNPFPFPFSPPPTSPRTLSPSPSSPFTNPLPLLPTPSPHPHPPPSPPHPPPLSHQLSPTLSLTQTHPGETRPSRCTASDERCWGIN